MYVEKRVEAHRDACTIDASIRLDSGRPEVACLVTDLTEQGAAIMLEERVVLPDRFRLALPVVDGVEHERAVELRWRRGPTAGLLFLPG